eukprot:GHUV01039755.1.p2 GENE.GHUV01039755.1~~GHUV01039755.1.p2  ORF type:complete len:114 (-),score=17.22 GHUV01039755.1:406-747(-)
MLPQALCDTWAWIRWDHAGRPNRSEAQADDEYEAAVQEMHALLAAGRYGVVSQAAELYHVCATKSRQIDFEHSKHNLCRVCLPEVTLQMKSEKVLLNYLQNQFLTQIPNLLKS